MKIRKNSRKTKEAEEGEKRRQGKGNLYAYKDKIDVGKDIH